MFISRMIEASSGTARAQLLGGKLRRCAFSAVQSGGKTAHRPRRSRVRAVPALALHPARRTSFVERMLHVFPDLRLGRARENAGYGRREASDRREAFRHFPHRAARFFKSDLAFVRRNKAFPGVRRRTRKYPELRARREHRAHHDKLRAVFGQRGRTERKYGKRHRHRKCGERRKRNAVLPQKPCDKRRGKYRGDQRRLKRERCGKRIRRAPRE